MSELLRMQQRFLNQLHALIGNEIAATTHSYNLAFHHGMRPKSSEADQIHIRDDQERLLWGPDQLATALPGSPIN